MSRRRRANTELKTQLVPPRQKAFSAAKQARARLDKMNDSHIDDRSLSTPPATGPPSQASPPEESFTTAKQRAHEARTPRVRARDTFPNTRPVPSRTHGNSWVIGHGTTLRDVRERINVEHTPYASAYARQQLGNRRRCYAARRTWTPGRHHAHGIFTLLATVACNAKGARLQNGSVPTKPQATIISKRCGLLQPGERGVRLGERLPAGSPRSDAAQQHDGSSAGWIFPGARTADFVFPTSTSTAPCEDCHSSSIKEAVGDRSTHVLQSKASDFRGVVKLSRGRQAHIDLSTQAAAARLEAVFATKQAWRRLRCKERWLQKP